MLAVDGCTTNRMLVLTHEKARRSLKNTLALAVAGLTTAGILIATPVTPAAAQSSIVVNNIGDGADTNPGDGTCRTASNVCTLRAAVDEANGQRGPNSITFGIPGSGVKRIALGRTLYINDPTGGTTIDGYSQSGAASNTHATKSNAAIRVEVTTTSALNPMILVESAENEIRGLAIWGNGPRIELRGEAADGNKIAGNFIGTDSVGTATSDLPAGSATDFRLAFAGVALNLGPDRNVIGGPNNADRNVIAGNGQFGIRINHGETSENVIENNIIGMTPDATASNPQRIGIDIQWWSWGNYVTKNLISGQTGQGIDLSHTSVENTVVNNRIGTGPGGNGGNAQTANRWGITFKDNSMNNVVADNVIGSSTDDGIWHRHNYTGSNTVVGNRIGVGLRGANIGNSGYGMTLRGHDDLYHGNIIANNAAGGVFITNTTPAFGGSTTYPAEKTLGNVIRHSTFYGTNRPFIDIEAVGQNANDAGDGDDGAHLLLNFPTVTGIGPGQVFGQACPQCTVEVYVSGALASDGTLDPTSSSRGTGAAWIARGKANANGRFSVAAPAIRSGKDLMLLAIASDGNTSEFSPTTIVPASFQGSGSNATPSLGALDRPSVPGRPSAHQPVTFSCRVNGSTLSWDDAGVAEYYVFYTANGQEGYVGPVRGRSVSVPRADSYRVEHWSTGFATNANCLGQGVATFSCSYQGGTLSWTDVQAGEYYAFATTNGTERYIGPVQATSVATSVADSYRVEHWIFGRVTNAICQS